MKLARPQEGQDRYWVVWTKGEVSAEVAEERLGQRLRVMIRVNATVAYNQDTGIDEEALLLRVPPGCASAIARAITD
eukprot:583824-Lingulodinium_polyedra.AAC.1